MSLFRFFSGAITLVLSLSSIFAGEISFSEDLTDDESSGISSFKVYTHTISGGAAATVNGVEFDLLNDSQTPSEFDWEVSSVKNQLQNSVGWDPFAGGVEGPDLLSLLGAFTFNNDGNPGSNQTFTLTGLTPGQEYEARIYCRKYSDGSERTQEVIFTAGDQGSDSILFAEDRPEEDPIGVSFRDSAYYISYTYTADAAASLSIRFEVTGAPGAGSFHMYGLSNETLGVFHTVAETDEFIYEVEENGVISKLIGSYDGEAEETEFTLVEGDGDDDNSLFRIVDDELRAGRFDFSSAEDGTLYYVRIKGRGLESEEVGETELVFTLIGEQEPTPFSFVGPLTDDDSSGISPENDYTHAISGGAAENVNGVEFEALNNNFTPDNFSWDVSSTKNQIDNNNGAWDVGASGVTGQGLLDLLGSFTYNSDGAVGSKQTFTLSGLESGGAYEIRLYMRKWANDTQRQQLVEFTSGETTDSITFSEDHPELEPIEMQFRDEAFYMAYAYTAGADGELSITFNVVDDVTQGAPGSFHMYGMTNQILQPSADDDNDGLPDVWEEKYGVDDPEGDEDNDGLSNADEYEYKTRPDKADTDEDGLNDAKEINITEYYDFSYEYKNDCLIAGVKYNKTFYQDNDLKPSENLFFTLTLIPLTTYERIIYEN